MAARSLSRHCIQSSSHTGTTARIFLHLTSRQPHLILDFLAPRVPNHVLFPTQQCARSLPKADIRSFSTSSARKETVTILNPRSDDDGHAMSVEITPRASNRLREIMVKDENPNLALRITVESGGCHGFQYLMSLTTLPPLSSFLASAPARERSGDPDSNTSAADPDTASPTRKDVHVDEDDTVFKAMDGSEAKVVMDGPSLELLRGSKIDYTMELIGSQFKIVDNPLATSSCGCGTSFDIKV